MSVITFLIAGVLLLGIVAALLDQTTRGRTERRVLAQAAHQLGLRLGRRGLEGVLRGSIVRQRMEEHDSGLPMVRLEVRSEQTPDGIQLDLRTQHLVHHRAGGSAPSRDATFNARYRVRRIDRAGREWLTNRRRRALLTVADEADWLSIEGGLMTAWYRGEPSSGRDLAGMVHRLLAVVEPA